MFSANSRFTLASDRSERSGDLPIGNALLAQFPLEGVNNQFTLQDSIT